MEDDVAQGLFKRFAKPGETLDDDWIEAIGDAIVEEGELVASHSWNSGGPGVGAGVTFVYKYRGLFFTSTDFDIGGPYGVFTEAAEAVNLLGMTDTTENISVDYKVEGNSLTSDGDDGTMEAEKRRLHSGIDFEWSM
jgi:hypothetical protein